MKVVINKCFGGFSLSHEAMLRLANMKGLTVYPEDHKFFFIYWTAPKGERTKSGSGQTFSESDIERDDADLVRVVEDMGKAANGSHADLKVVEIPDGTDYEISEYDGVECIAETHRTWE